LRSLRLFPDRPHVLSAYALGKAQRLIALLRAAGYDRPIPVARQVLDLCAVYERFGVRLGRLVPLESADSSELAGGILIGRADGLREPVISFASGWMRLRANAKAQGGELPLIISDHADWPELLSTLNDVKPRELWITHGREDAIAHHARARGIKANSIELGFVGEGGE
jgi:putative mRNA 3-end processing factor